MNNQFQNKSQEGNKPIVSSILTSLLAGVICLVVGTLIIAGLVNSGNLTEVSYAIMILWFLTSAIATAISYATVKKSKLICAASTVLVLLFLTMGSNILFFEGSFAGVGKCLLPVLVGTLLPIVSVTLKKKNYSKHKKYKFH